MITVGCLLLLYSCDQPPADYTSSERFYDEAQNDEFVVAPEWESDCDPNYIPCVPIASDVDCGSGSGNGPEYVYETVQVVGRDIYDLDRDNNGWGCE